jgi:hypothetical protein
LAVVAVTAVVGGCSGDDGAGDASVDRRVGEVAKPVRASANPVADFAPLIVLHSRETLLPISADAFIERATLKWEDDRCMVLESVATGSVADIKAGEGVPRLQPRRLAGHPPYERRQLDRRCRREVGPRYPTTVMTRQFVARGRPRGLPLTTGFYLDVLSASRNGVVGMVKRGSAAPVLTGATAYYARSGGSRSRRDRISYWMLYGRAESETRGGETIETHEGDWERVDVTVRRAGRDRWLPVAARLRPDGPRLPWRRLRRSGQHPIAYASLASHTHYPRPGDHERPATDEGRPATAFDQSRSCDSCPRWQTWDRLRRVSVQPWYGYRGGWGLAFQSEGTTGPLGPMPGG